MSRRVGWVETEASFQQAVLEAALHCGWRRHHTRKARTLRGWRTPLQGDAGYQDLTLVRGPRVIAAECKLARGRLSDDQKAWLRAWLAVPGVEVYIFRPQYWRQIERTLKRR
jgi:hypothetical protein